MHNPRSPCFLSFSLFFTKIFEFEGSVGTFFNAINHKGILKQRSLARGFSRVHSLH
jgi:hypothetical protein